MGKSMKDILEKGSKDKLIQLAIDTPDFNRDGVDHPTLTQEEIDTIWEKAKKEKWDKELGRALYKAQDTEALVLHTKGTFYEAMYNISDFTKEVQRSEIFLDVLRHKYLQRFNGKTGKYEKVIKKDRKEIKQDIEETLDKVLPALSFRVSSTFLKQTQKHLESFNEEELKKHRISKKMKEEALDIEERVLLEAPYVHFKTVVGLAKMGLYLVKENKLEGYRLYREDMFTDINYFIQYKLSLLVMDLVSSLEHIDFMLDNIPKYLPELAEELEHIEDMYLPDKKRREEILEFLNSKMKLPVTAVVEADTKKEKDKIWKEYLLNDIPEEILRKIEENEDKVERYVKYGE